MTSVNDTVSPEDLNPKSIKEYPALIERSEKLRREARQRTDEALECMQRIEDAISEELESKTYLTVVGKKNPQTIEKKIYKSADSLKRELRKKLLANEEYRECKTNFAEWDERTAAWVSHIAKLRRELRLKEIDFVHYGRE